MRGSPAYYSRQNCPDQVHLGHGQALAVEEMLRVVKSSRAFDPFGVYVPWAKQNGSLAWDTITDPDHEVVLYPITADTVARVNAGSYGSEVPWVGVVTETPVNALTADAAWDATRYDLFETEGIYDVDDMSPAPRICFLYWAKLHDDVGGGRESLDDVAKRLGGRLVFPAQIAIVGARRPPVIPFQTVLDAQLMGPAGLPGMEGVGMLRGLGDAAPVPAAPPPPPSFLSTGTGKLLLGAGAAGALWALFGRKRPKRRAR